MRRIWIGYGGTYGKAGKSSGVRRWRLMKNKKERSGAAHEGKRHVAYMIAKSMVIYRYT